MLPDVESNCCFPRNRRYTYTTATRLIFWALYKRCGIAVWCDRGFTYKRMHAHNTSTFFAALHSWPHSKIIGRWKNAGTAIWTSKVWMTKKMNMIAEWPWVCCLADVGIQYTLNPRTHAPISVRYIKAGLSINVNIEPWLKGLHWGLVV